MANHSGPMACPVDGAALVMSERSGIEIDYCPTCRGVWLDRGELDKIIERSAAAAPPPPPPADRPPPRDDDVRRHGDDRRYGGDDRHSHEDRYRRRKRGSFLEELFDFD